MNVHHIGYLVKKGEKAAQAFEALGYEREGGWTHDEVRRVDILFLQKDGYRIELVSPYTADSVVSGLLKMRRIIFVMRRKTFQRSWRVWKRADISALTSRRQRLPSAVGG